EQSLSPEEEARLKALTEAAAQTISEKQLKSGSARLLAAIQNGDPDETVPVEEDDSESSEPKSEAE
ncbi:MAG: hypothetical protein COU68_02735, partial [Candidatus Pacebacteria bacterium CG10_big_fil_rev_8_21_14_0_10_45_6]